MTTLCSQLTLLLISSLNLAGILVILMKCIYDRAIQKNKLNVEVVYANEKYKPNYATPLDACMDLKIVIPEVEEVLKPGKQKVFGTGVQVKVPKDYCMLMFPRSSTGIKLGCRLANSTGVIDAGYRDEIKVCLHNFSNKPIQLQDGQRVAQFMIIPRNKLNLIRVNDDGKFRANDRLGGIGSTN